MTTNSLQPEGGHDGAFSSLSASIEALNLVNQNTSVESAKSVFGSAGVLLATIRDLMVNQQDYVVLGFSCAGVCQALDRGLSGRRMEELSGSVLWAIEKLTTTVAAIQEQIVKQDQKNPALPSFHARNDKEMIAAWGRDFDRVLHIFNMELSINNHMVLLNIHRDVQAVQGGTDGRHQPIQASIPLGELPPPPPGACFGRDALIEKIVGLADTFNSIALIGAGGIGKTSVALAVLHHDRIQEQFGSNRRFVRCDNFPASRPNFLRRLSKVIGADMRDPEDLVSLRPFLSLTKMIIVLDNAESILDPQGTDGKEIYDAVEELSRFSNICLAITSRITTVPPNCETIEISMLSMEAAHDVFYRIYKYGKQSDLVNDILRQMDFHPLSVTLLATVAHQYKWDNGRLAKEWKQRQTGVLHTEHNDSLAATINLSLASPMFQGLGPDARRLLEVIAFFPQGVDENNLDWLFPTIPNINAIFDKFCILSLTYRSDGFVTMLAPLRDHLRPINPKRSSLLCAAKELYFTRLSVDVDPNTPTFGETRWIISEDVNLEHLLDVFTSIDKRSDSVWSACGDFIKHLYWHKPRQTILRSRIECLPDDHPSKPECLFRLSRLFNSMGNNLDQILFLLRVLEIRSKEGDQYRVAQTLLELSGANRMLGLREEGIRQVKEALKIMERVGRATDRAVCLNALAYSLHDDKQLDEARDAASRAIALSEKGQELETFRSHHILGAIYSSEGERKKAIHHYEVALGIASPFKWHTPMFWIHHSMANLFCDEGTFDDAQAHITQAKLHAADDTYCLGRAMEVQARILYRQKWLADAIPEAACAIETLERLGAVAGFDASRALQDIEPATESQAISGG
ncbi:hypothetical protein BJ322DRAFT_1104480 [Thelephora terrestris]|uniref:NB-ARC domain-containing protein n=1 Tax=Thelephora terrestris TaxID=56493 RepID=A0A9P6LB36_9AGAM|nr:hypothetical protein BJ322DRAFT_1104480 [Thelephora terrestris]